MIVELFGAPGAGKTTFARALARSLGERGLAVEAHISARPGEEAPDQRPPSPPARLQRLFAPVTRLSRAALEFSSATRLAGRSSPRAAAIARLMAALPPGRPFAALRTRQYLIRLAAAWGRAETGGRIVVFDQAWIQAAASVLVDGARAEDRDVAALVDAAPQADLAIHIAAPTAEIERRLALRLRDMGRIGALFEAAGGDADPVRTYDRLAQALAARGRPLLRFDSADATAMPAGFERIVAEIATFARSRSGADRARQAAV